MIGAIFGILLGVYLGRYAVFFLQAILSPVLIGLAWSVGWIIGRLRRWRSRPQAARIGGIKTAARMVVYLCTVALLGYWLFPVFAKHIINGFLKLTILMLNRTEHR